MKLTTTTTVSVDGVTQGLGAPDEDRRGGFERGGWAIPLFDDEAATFLPAVWSKRSADVVSRISRQHRGDDRQDIPASSSSSPRNGAGRRARRQHRRPPG